ncbi:hypothetical protein ILUMI_19258 [Ignelater luminosus]|uniref:Transposable element P transposase-like RNase H domain-containing protein n=1 Tax=Ignelater luminosus TaxID=2038154 RepID=A0A8K0CMQ9_IGNLU|nr:hypothetical protein ILUMI_19258 [Ignelater luminosus]
MPPRNCCVPGCIFKGVERFRLSHPRKEEAMLRKWINIIGDELRNMSLEDIYNKKRILLGEANNRRYDDAFLESDLMLQPSTSKNSPPKKKLDKTSQGLLQSAGVTRATHLTPKASYLCGAANSLKRKVRHLHKKCRGLKSRLGAAFKLTEDEAFPKAANNMTAAAKLFTNLQMRETHKKARGRRFTLEEKILSLTKYKQSPKAYLIGFQDYGDGQVKDCFADHVLVFRLRAIKKKFKQPIASSFTQGQIKTPDLMRVIKEIVRERRKAGLNIICTVCDQGTSNESAIKTLMKQTEEDYLRNGDEWRVARRIHLRQLFEADPGADNKRVLPKLTEAHVNPDKMPKMKAIDGNLATHAVQQHQASTTPSDIVAALLRQLICQQNANAAVALPEFCGLEHEDPRKFMDTCRRALTDFSDEQRFLRITAQFPGDAATWWRQQAALTTTLDELMRDDIAVYCAFATPGTAFLITDRLRETAILGHQFLEQNKEVIDTTRLSLLRGEETDHQQPDRANVSRRNHSAVEFGHRPQVRVLAGAHGSSKPVIYSVHHSGRCAVSISCDALRGQGSTSDVPAVNGATSAHRVLVQIRVGVPRRCNRLLGKPRTTPTSS